MSCLKQTIPKHYQQESETLRVLRLKFHNYSKSQQISSVRPSGENSLKSTLKENDGLNWRQTLKMPLKNQPKNGSISKIGLTQKPINQIESDFTKKAREVLMKNFNNKIVNSVQNCTKKQVLCSPKPPEKNRSILISHFKTRF